MFCSFFCLRRCFRHKNKRCVHICSLLWKFRHLQKNNKIICHLQFFLRRYVRHKNQIFSHLQLLWKCLHRQNQTRSYMTCSFFYGNVFRHQNHRHVHISSLFMAVPSLTKSDNIYIYISFAAFFAVMFFRYKNKLLSHLQLLMEVPSSTKNHMWFAAFFGWDVFRLKKKRYFYICKLLLQCLHRQHKKVICCLFCEDVFLSRKPQICSHVQPFMAVPSSTKSKT